MKVNRMGCKDVVKALVAASASGDTASAHVENLEVQHRLVISNLTPNQKKHFYRKCAVCAQKDECDILRKGKAAA